ncbi:MAG: hypothetical protein ACLU8W_11625 [Clostridia bacterium]
MKVKKQTIALLTISLLTISIVGCVILGIVTHLSYRNDVSKMALSSETVMLFDIGADDSESYYAPYREELLNADIVVKATPVGERQYEYQATLTTLRIEEVYKGNLHPGETINYFEINSFFYKDGIPTYMNISPINLMQNGISYIVFGKDCNYSPIYKETLSYKTYRDASIISYFQSKMTIPPILNEGEKIFYQDIQNNEFNCFSEKKRNAMIRFKQETLHAFGIKPDT